MKPDLNLLSQLIDEALEKETTESVDTFLEAHPDPLPNGWRLLSKEEIEDKRRSAYDYIF